jgi:hypothetical protein
MLNSDYFRTRNLKVACLEEIRVYNEKREHSLLNVELIVLFAVNGRTFCISGYNLAGENNISIEISCIDHG